MDINFIFQRKKLVWIKHFLRLLLKIMENYRQLNLYIIKNKQSSI